MKIIILASIFLLSSCDLFESDYERLIKDVRAQKLKEKKLGIPNPVFEGIREPDFPNEEENNKTFEGVDANKDGIRDDIEIWINRISEDKEVRIATKHYFKLNLKFIRGVKNNDSPENNTSNLNILGGANFCLAKSYGAYRKKFLTQNSRSIEMDVIDNLQSVFFNTPERKIELEKAKYTKLKGLISTDSDNLYSHCSENNNLEYLKKEW
jgi:hypothetical protein